jgi:two-component system sensor histidine kinase/response regulator
MSVVLVADDDPVIRETIAEIISALGHEALIAADGEEAVELARRAMPALVITDYLMPRKTGVEVIRTLRNDAHLAAIPVLLISATQPRGTEEAWKFLAKPCTLADLTCAIIAGISIS